MIEGSGVWSGAEGAGLMTDTKHFDSKDIGAELLPIMTTGIYRDPLDALREYIQNAIDAEARNVEITIGSDVVSVRDDGHGMTRSVAEKAIRLGLSEKDPRYDVGFRGIGIYSAFDVCSELEVFTRSAKSPTSRLVIEFDKIRKVLSDEEKHRLKGKKSRLSLVKLLQDRVYVDECETSPLATQGTLVVMNGLKGHSYKRFIDRGQVKRYLQSVVPLPFHPDFHHKKAIEKLFERKDYPIVNLVLVLDRKSEPLHRPYHNTMFDYGRGYGPKHYRLSSLFSGGPLGFAWVCLNDARKVLPDQTLRGLVIKKFGFSVGDRDQFARFFGRQFFNKRVTGEIIITHKELLPNAARTEFEPSELRDALYVEFARLATHISSWADGVQTELKAREELQRISPEVFQMARDIPSNERDVEALLKFNTKLSAFQNSLKVHRQTLLKLESSLYERTVSAIRQAKKHITEILSGKGKTRKQRQRRMEQAMASSVRAPKADELTVGADRPASLTQAIVSMEADVPSQVRRILQHIDGELRRRLSEEEYSDLLDSVLDAIDESI